MDSFSRCLIMPLYLSPYVLMQLFISIKYIKKKKEKYLREIDNQVVEQMSNVHGMQYSRNYGKRWVMNFTKRKYEK